MKVRNTFTQEVGHVVGAWRNIGGQLVLNVRVNGMAASWNAARCTVIENGKAA